MTNADRLAARIAMGLTLFALEGADVNKHARRVLAASARGDHNAAHALLHAHGHVVSDSRAEGTRYRLGRTYLHVLSWTQIQYSTAPVG